MSDEPGPWGEPTEWYTPPPGAGDEPPETPLPVRAAVKLMYGGAVLKGVSVIVGLARVGDLRDDYRERHSMWSDQQLASPTDVEVATWVFIGLVLVGIWV